MIEIPLTKGYVAIISDEDADLLNRKWHWATQYARCSKGQMHRIIAERMIGGEIGRSKVVDHINRNKLDNRRENLRVVSPSENALNRDYVKQGQSGIKGVTYDKIHGRWVATVYRKGVHRIGSFKTKEEAAEAYKQAADRIFGVNKEI